MIPLTKTECKYNPTTIGSKKRPMQPSVRSKKVLTTSSTKPFTDTPRFVWHLRNCFTTNAHIANGSLQADRIGMLNTIGRKGVWRNERTIPGTTGLRIRGPIFTFRVSTAIKSERTSHGGMIQPSCLQQESWISFRSTTNPLA